MQAGGLKLVVVSLLVTLLGPARLEAREKSPGQEASAKKTAKPRPTVPPKKPTTKDTPPKPPRPEPEKPPPPQKPTPPDPKKPLPPEPQKPGSADKGKPTTPGHDVAPAAAATSAGAEVVAESVARAIAQELVETRPYRRDAAREALWKRWGVATREPAVRAELSLHGRRAARLRQVLRLAKAAGQAKIVERAELLLNLEDRRHERALSKLTALAAPSGGKP